MKHLVPNISSIKIDFIAGLLVMAMIWLPVAYAVPKNSKDRSDLNSDGAVDILDVGEFSYRILSF